MQRKTRVVVGILGSTAATAFIGAANHAPQAAVGKPVRLSAPLPNSIGLYAGTTDLHFNRAVEVRLVTDFLSRGENAKHGRAVADLNFVMPFHPGATPTPTFSRNAQVDAVLAALPLKQLSPPLPPFEVERRSGAFRVSRRYPQIGTVVFSGVLPGPARHGFYNLSLGGKTAQGFLSEVRVPAPSLPEGYVWPTATPSPYEELNATPTPGPVPTLTPTNR